MAAEPSSTKRRKINDSATAADEYRCRLSDLPSGILTHVVSYLAFPSRAIFAATLVTDINAACANERNSAIVGDGWDILNFGQIEKDLVSKLTDGDIEKVLQCIDAVQKVQKLKLTNCINITGAGLEPLRGSTIIEQIDLSLVCENQTKALYSLLDRQYRVSLYCLF